MITLEQICANWDHHERKPKSSRGFQMLMQQLQLQLSKEGKLPPAATTVPDETIFEAPKPPDKAKK